MTRLRTCARCDELHPAGERCQRAAGPTQRGYRGLAGYRELRGEVLERDGGVCHLCGEPGADTLDHLTPYSEQPEATRDDVATWNAAEFAAAHAQCNRRRGVRAVA